MSKNLNMNIGGTINLAGYMLNFVVDHDGTIRIPTPGKAEAIGVLNNIVERIEAAGIASLNGASVTTTPPPVTAGVTATEPIVSAAKAPARRGRTATASPAKNSLFAAPVANEASAAPSPAKRRGRPKGSGKKAKTPESAEASA